MKKLLLIGLLLFSSVLCSFAQTETPAKQSYIFCEIVGTTRVASNKCDVVLDFGQFNKYLSDQRLVDENGEVIVFNSMVDAMNWMGKIGWEFVQAYVLTNSFGYVYHWLLKLDLDALSAEEKEEVLSKLQTKRMLKDKQK